MPRSFAQLVESDEVITAKELKEVLHDYVVSGATINARVVIALIERTVPSSEDRVELTEDAKNGFWNQTQRNFPSDADEYKKVVLYLIR